MEQRDKFTITNLELYMAENSGWVAISRSEGGYKQTNYGAFTNKKDLIDWLEDNLRYATYQHEIEGEKGSEQ